MKSLYKVAIIGLKSANQNNPFWNKSQAMSAINGARKLPAPRRYNVIKHGRNIGHIIDPSLSHFAALSHMGYIVKMEG